MINNSCVLLLSGGLDSTTLLYQLKSEGAHVHAVLFDYGQNHWRELEFAQKHCEKLDVLWTRIEIDKVFKGWPFASRLVGGKVGDVVHFRNAVMLSIACSMAAANGVEYVIYGPNADDALLFADCRGEFINAFNRTLIYAELDVEVKAPFLHLTKKEIAKIAWALSVPIELTWSCYERGPVECGTCDACLKRKAALES